MLGYLIKNNLKLMLRSRVLILIMLIGPILTIAALSSGFHTLMSKYEMSDHVNVGYTGSDETFLQVISQIKDTASDNGIDFIQYDTDDYASALSQDNFDVYVVFDADTYTIYQDDDHKIQADTVSYFLTTMLKNIAYQPVQDLNQVYESSVTNQYQTHVIHKIPTLNSSDYYGIIEIIYFLWCGIISLAAVISSERKNQIETRFQMSAISRFQLFLGKAIPCVLAISIETAVSILICSFLFDIHWGNPLGCACILFVGIIAATTLGIALFYLFTNIVLSVMSAFVFAWCFGFVGGTFETYMYSRIPESVKLCSPIYYMNRTLVEYAAQGSSTYTIPAILYLIVFSVVCSLIGILLMKKRMEAK